ncbi:DUF2779 domain-containing protein [bacterium]|nr:DUF2779 domain-containing protein [bacterium]
MSLLTKSKYLAGLQCSKLLWMLVKAKDRIPAPAEDAQFRMDAGTEVGILAKQLFPEGIDIPTDDFMRNIYLTKDSLSNNAPLFEAGIMANNCYSRIDVLKPNDDGSFDIIEVKAGTKVKEENVHDVSFQKHCCEMAGLKIAKCHLCFIDNQYVRKGDINVGELFSIQDISMEVAEAQQGIQERIDKMSDAVRLSRCPSVLIGRHCDSHYTCNLKDECWEFLPENNIFTLCGGGGKSAELFNNGVHSIADIPDDFRLTDKQEIQKKCEKTGECHVQPSGIKQFLDTLNYPLYYLDFETFSPAVPEYDNSRPYQKIPFQYSLHIQQKDNKTKHFEFLAEGSEDPRPALLKNLKEVLGTKSSIVVYNQQFEKGVLGELARDFPKYQNWVNEILPGIVDLLIPFRNFCYYNPSQQGSASMKKVLPAITGESYEGMEIATGENASMQFFQSHIKSKSNNKEEIRKNLLKYCCLDTEGMVLIISELKKFVN